MDDIKVGDVYLSHGLRLYKVFEIKSENRIYVNSGNIKGPSLEVFPQYSFNSLEKFNKDNIKLKIAYITNEIRGSLYIGDIAIIGNLKIDNNDTERDLIDKTYNYILELNDVTEEELYNGEI